MRLTLTFLLLSLLPFHAFAQGERATVTGTVSDPSGAIVPAVAITIRNLETNATSRTATNSAASSTSPHSPPARTTSMPKKLAFVPPAF